MAPQTPQSSEIDDPDVPFKTVSIHLRITYDAFKKADDMAKGYHLPLMKFLKAVIYERLGILGMPLDMREKK